MNLVTLTIVIEVDGREPQQMPTTEKKSRPELNEMPAALPDKLLETLVLLVNLSAEWLKIISN